ncbi:MAG TPA: hypothetical protein VLE70_15685, partial [Anaerolineae bacterium]|nr:hypothetical protein [Anaerolineae bacterium]
VRPAAAEEYANTPLIGDSVTTLSSWRSLPEIGRFGQLLQSERGSGRVRVLIWEGALDLLGIHEPLEKPDGEADAFNFLRPILGYGPESMYVAYNRFYPPELATIEARNASPDRSHNETFDAVVITGAAGLLVWQLLYLSVFYYGFRWLGVVKSNRDRNVLIGLWIGGAILGGAAITVLLGMPFIGIAVPFGAIFGLVLYLIYYAIFSRRDELDADVDPFGVDRLIMIGLVAAMLAHYVEIHFGIAIASTRTHFFVYLALMFMVGYFLPRLKDAPVAAAPQVKKRKKAKRAQVVSKADGWTSPLLGTALMLALIVGILAFNFMTFSLPPGEAIDSIEDVPQVGAIFQQSYFLNAKKAFAESPFIYLLMILTWALGTLLYLSELSKRGLIGLSGAAGAIQDERLRRGALALLAMALVSAGVAVFTFLTRDQEPAGLLGRMGFWLLLIYAATCLWASLRILRYGFAGRQTAGVVALAGLVFALPALVAGGGVYAIGVGALAAVSLYLLWDKSWNRLYLPAAIMALGSLTIGLIYTYLHALMIRNGILPPEGVTETTAATVRRVLEADQTTAILAAFYLFLFLMLAATGLAFAWEKMSRVKASATLGGSMALVILLPLTFYVVAQTNLQVIQADVVYKRADPWDKQAGRSGDPSLWDNAIAIYEHAIDLAPREDFYYLWLGRAYLERSSVTEDLNEQESLLRTAEQRLIEAQRINPLNTDHTANLARLNTRWAELAADQERQERVEIASNYYEAAMSLSPNNAVIINEFARLAFVLDEDCDKALALFDRSTERDPYYANTLFEQYEILRVCGDRQSEEADRLLYYERAAESYSEGLRRQPRAAEDWLQLAGLYIVLGQIDEALAAYDEASNRREEDLEQWRIDFTIADWFLQEEYFDRAQEFGRRALDGAPADVAEQIQQFIDSAAAAGGQVDG